MFERNDELERISDLIRHGTPVGFYQAIAAIDYQNARKQHECEQAELTRQNAWWRRAIGRIRSPLTAKPGAEGVK